jgi:2-dehydropantoate 2-reductase
MKIAVYGAGAIGGYLAAELARAGAAVTVIARGRTLAAIRARGIVLEIGGETRTTRVAAVERGAEAGPQDYVIVATKANQAPALVPEIRAMLGPETAVVSAVNGIPWWYFHKLAGPYENRIVETVDPAGAQWNGIGPARAIGCVVYPACEAIEPGRIRHVSENRFTLGEPDGSKSGRVLALAEMFVKAGFQAPVRAAIRTEIWVKLWGNLSFNPISALTGATLEQMAFDPEIRGVVRAMMVEAEAIGAALGVRFPIDVDKRIDGGGRIGAHRTSMLQDVEARRPLEIDALVSVVQELGRMTGIATPAIDIVLALVRKKAKLLGLYP